MNDIKEVISHNIKIGDRTNIELSGINKIISFDKEEFILSSVMGQIIIKGKNLEILLLDTESGNVKIKGVINGLNYYEDKTNNIKDNFWTRLFK